MNHSLSAKKERLVLQSDHAARSLAAKYNHPRADDQQLEVAIEALKNH